MVYGIVIFLVSCYFCAEHRSVHSVVLEPTTGHYTIYKDHAIAISKPAHNIYIRLKQKRTGTLCTQCMESLI